jgi:hypothetical protein
MKAAAFPLHLAARRRIKIQQSSNSSSPENKVMQSLYTPVLKNNRLKKTAKFA